jgi:hypothetical protein
MSRSPPEGDLLLFTEPAPTSQLLMSARCRRIPVLAPDSWSGRWVRDGVTGFVYRAGNPDSLALSLLAFAMLPERVVSEIAGRAHAHDTTSSIGSNTPFTPFGGRP